MSRVAALATRMPVLGARCLDPASVPTRPAAARAGGFDRIGLSLSQVRRWLDGGGSLGELDRELARHGVVVAELGSLDLGAGPGGLVDLAVELAGRYGAHHVQANATEGSEASLPAFAALCDRLGGMTVGLEPLPWTSVPDLAAAARIVAAAGRPNAGVCLDVWHHFRNGGYLSAIAPFAARIVAVRLSDGPPGQVTPTERHDSRLAPGEGSFPLTGLLELLGDEANLTIEVSSDESRARPAEETARLLGSAARRLLGLPEDAPGAVIVVDPAHVAEIRAAITSALAAGARLTDERRPDALAERFTPDCRVSHSPRSTALGRTALRDYFRDTLARCSATSHLLGLPEVVVDGPYRARSVVTVQGWHRLLDGSQIVLYGRYVDRWELSDTAGWLIADRRLEVSGAVGRDISGFHPISADPIGSDPVHSDPGQVH